MIKLLITAKPMIIRIDQYQNIFDKYHIKTHIPEFEQILSEQELIDIVPKYDAWIIGDDPVTKNVLDVGIKGNLKCAVKWGVGTDNIDFSACKELKFNIPNTPGMFNEEVSNVALGYLLSLAHNLHNIDRESRVGNWYKPTGMSLENKKVALIGYGNIGKTLKLKLEALKMNVMPYDPITYTDISLDIALGSADFIICTCSLTSSSYHIINKYTINMARDGVYIINVARGPIICEKDLIEALDSGKVRGAALDVFEEEPINIYSELYKYNVILGSHNSSNTVEAVDRTSILVIEKIIQKF